MKHNLLLSVLAFLAINIFCVNAQTTLYNANFDNFVGDNAMTFIDVSGGDWTYGTDANAFGAGSYIYVERSNTTVSGTIPVYTETRAYTPVIDLTGYERLKLSLDILIDTEAEWDGVNIYYSLDGGTTFAILGKDDDPSGTDWYNDNDVDALADIERGWSGRLNSSNWFNASIDLSSQPFDDAPSVRFRIELGTDNTDGGSIYYGAAVDNIKVEGYPITAKTYGSCAGINLQDKLELWLKPSDLESTLNDGDSVDRWPNATGINPDWTDAQSSGALRPTYYNNASENVNFNPVVSFDGSKEMFGKEGFYNAEMYVVIKPDTPVYYTSGVQDIFMGDDYTTSPGSEDITGISINDTSARYGAQPDIVGYNQGANTSYGKAIVSNMLQYPLPIVFNARLNAAGTGMDLYFDGLNLESFLGPGFSDEVNLATYYDILNSRYWLGGSEFWGPSFGGDVLEIMVYSEKKSEAERVIITSYLSTKYGITQGLFGTPSVGLPHIPGVYLNSIGTSMWHPATDTGFTNNVAGIGRDDCLLLNQKQGVSVDPYSFITVALGDMYATNSANPNNFANNFDYLMWGSVDVLSLSTPTAILATPLQVDLGADLMTEFEATERTWKFKEITAIDIPEVQLSINAFAFAELPAPTGNESYVMLVSDVDDFSSNVETVFLTPTGPTMEGKYDFDGTKYVKFAVAQEIVSSRHIEFDGQTHFAKVGDELDQTGAFSVTAWVNLDGDNDDSSDKTIVSKADSSNNGYHFYVENGNNLGMRFGPAGAQTIVSNTVLSEQEWRHVAFTFDGTTAKLYIDGVEDNSKAFAAPTNNSNQFAIGARYVNKGDIRNFFAGKLDEIRLFDSALPVDEIRFTMNQEIEADGALVDGTVIHNSVTNNDLNGRAWTDLQAYFDMNTYVGTHLNDASSNTHKGALLQSDNFDIDEQTAPLPYISASDGNWEDLGTWENDGDIYLPNTSKTINGVATDIDWNIVQTGHLVTSNSNQVVLGLMNTANTLSIENNTKLEVTHYLKIDSKIDLVGASQLVQTLDSDLDPTSAGVIERDQQGESNRFNYNYWSLPVGISNATTNNNDYTLSANFKDGRTATPTNINWVVNHDSNTTPGAITLSNYWLYRYASDDDDYANWIKFIETDNLTPGHGFTMKGSNAGTPNQNYTFIGKPHNGNISTNVGADELILLGNPYASAINASTFITDNLANINGTLYFWEHFNTNSSHVLSSYEGGYAVRNLTGGVAPVSPVGISGLGSSTRIPNQFIPVGQGFFVEGSATGGPVVFDNNQRAFVKEDNAASNILFRTSNRSNEFNNEDDVVHRDNFIRIRLGITSVSKHKRQLLLGFMDRIATHDYDNGYDGKVNEVLPSDAYFNIPDYDLVIQAVDSFDENDIYPITVKSDQEGLIEFNIDDISHPESIDRMYIYDKENGTYYDIVIKEKAVVIENHTKDETLKSLELINTLGQKIITWDLENETQDYIKLPIKKMTSGVYFLKLTADSGKKSIKKTIID